jgi:hypothetical protein
VLGVSPVVDESRMGGNHGLPQLLEIAPMSIPAAYLSDGIESAGLLSHAMGNEPNEWEVEVTLIQGD